MEQIIKKAWKISAKDLVEPWHYDDIVVFAENRNQARSEGLKGLNNMYAKVENIKNYFQESDVEFTDVIAHREKESDMLLFEGKEIKRYELNHYLWKQKRDEEAYNLTQTNPNDLAVVWAGCYNSYWGANRSGYSSDILYAGLYSTQEAYDIVRGSDYGRQEIVKLIRIEEYNDTILERISKKQEEVKKINEDIFKLSSKIILG